ncbi:MAG: hypothetical protein ACD_73C00822G0004 [uncultured bacterium]|nr:MAG: hypothetical protein ACD_73C00822G0004 [uncultured bacterium]
MIGKNNYMTLGYSWIVKKNILSPNGALSVIGLPSTKHQTFKRLFYITKAPRLSIRGEHAHKLCTQIMMCLKGQIEVNIDDGTNKETLILSEHSEALLLPPGLWSSQKYLTDDSLLIVLADIDFDENEYIRNYQDFLNWVNNHDAIK